MGEPNEPSIQQEAAEGQMPTGFVRLESDHDIGSIWDPLKQKKKKKVIRPIIFNETWLSSQAGLADETAA